MSRGEYRVIRPRERTARALRAPNETGKLRVLRGKEAGRQISIDEELVAGRAGECGIVLDDAEVSRKHARFFRMPTGQYAVEDLFSTNGTYVNGDRIVDQKLQYGDYIQLGGHEFLFSRYIPMQSQLVKRQRMEALGRLSAGSAHDFNNMLAVVTSSSEYLAELLAESAVAGEALECVDDIGQAASCAQALALRMLSLARTGDRTHQRVDVSNVCRELSVLLRTSIPRSVEMESEIDANLFVAGDAVDLYQLVMNLMLNARDALPEGGTLRLSATRDVPGDRVCIQVSDTGVGMDQATRERIFEPFFSTKGDEGMGLGLSTVREIISSHAGTVTVVSELGAGTTFRIELPAADPDVAQASAQVAPPPLGNEPLCLLLARR